MPISSTLWDVGVRKECCAACGSALQTVHLLSTCSAWCWVYITALGPPRSRSRCLFPKHGAGPTSTLEVGGRRVEPANLYLCECSKITYSCLGACVCVCVCVCVMVSRVIEFSHIGARVPGVHPSHRRRGRAAERCLEMHS